MCGINGIFGKNVNLALDGLIQQMNSSVIKRGPDNQSHKLILGGALGHTRLSFVDLSASGDQPMESRSGNVIVFNGEIYNYRYLAERFSLDLPSNQLSDTRVLLELIDKVGISNALNAACGMFALAYVDNKKSVVTLARDRFGEKPLYYFSDHEHFVFSSAIKGVQCHPHIMRRYNPDAIHEYLCFGARTGRQSCFDDIFELSPGHYIDFQINNNQIKSGEDKRWWEPSVGKQEKPNFSSTSLEALLDQVVIDHLDSDVELGCFLSGGIDSSLVAALAQKNSKRKLKTFTMGFKEKEHNESYLARTTANFLETEHFEFFVSASEIIDLTQNTLNSFDEPFSDSSAVAMYKLSEFAKKEVKGVLTGDGADEFWGGYKYYTYTKELAEFGKSIPFINRAMLMSILPNIVLRNMSPKIFRALQLLTTSGTHWGAYAANRIDYFCQAVIASPIDVKHADLPEQKDFVRALMMLDERIYLSADILKKVDTTSMMHSLEARAPFLDQRVINFVREMPTDALFDKKVGKIPLRQLANKMLPKEVLNAPKHGFTVPVGSWCREKLFPQIGKEKILELMREIPLIDTDKLSKYIHLWQAGDVKMDTLIWRVIVLYLWNERNHFV